LEDFLNDTVYNQAVVNWTVDKLSDKDVNFDLDRDGYVDVSSWTTAEMDVIIDNCDPGGYDKVVFIVNNPSELWAGCTYDGSSYAFIFPDSYEERSTAHELGHGVSIPHHSPVGGGADNCIMRYIFNEINTHKKSANNDGPAWMAMTIPNSFCTDPDPDNCKDTVDVSDAP